MNIQIDDNTRITSDAYNIIIEGRKVAGENAKNAGEERWVGVSFHSNLQQALQWLAERDIRVSQAQSIDDLVKDVDKAYSKLKRLIAEVK